MARLPSRSRLAPTEGRPRGLRLPGPEDVPRAQGRIVDPGVEIPPGAFGQGAAEALVDLGKGIMSFAGGLRGLAEQREQAEATAFVNSATIDLTTEGFKDFLAAKSSAPENPVGFTDSLLERHQQRTQELLSAAPSDEARRKLTEDAGRIKKNLALRSTLFEHNARSAAVVKTTESGLDDLAFGALRSPDMADAFEDLGLSGIAETERAGGLTGAKANELRESFRQKLRANQVRGLIDIDPEGMAEDLKAGLFDKQIGDADLARVLTREAERRATTSRTEAEAEQNAEQARLASDLEIAVRRGEKSYEAVEQAFQNEIISPAKRTQLTTIIDQRTEKAKKESQFDELVSLSFTGRGSLVDPKDKNHRAAVDRYYRDKIIPEVASLPPEQGLNKAVDYIAATGVVPSAVMSQIRASFRSGSPDQQASAADFLDRIRMQNPAALNSFADNDIERGVHIASLTRAGVPPADAVKLANDAEQVSPDVRKVRRDRAREDKHRKKNAEFLEDETGEFLAFDPKIPDAMTGEFNRLQGLAFERTGDLEASQKTALAQVQRVWGVTGVGGEKRFMKYAPEKIYGVGAFSAESNAEWMQEQLIQELKDRETLSGLVSGTENFEDKVRIAADLRTAREFPRPSYQVMTLNEHGAPEPIIDADGNPVRWFPSWQKSPEFTRVAAEAAEATSSTLRRARKERERLEGLTGTPLERARRTEQEAREKRRSLTGAVPLPE